MTFREVIAGAAPDERMLAQIFKDTQTPVQDQAAAQQALTSLWQRLEQEPPGDYISARVVHYSVNLFTGDPENFSLRCWYEVFTDRQLYERFHPIPEYDRLDIWNQEDTRLRDLPDLHVRCLLPRGRYLKFLGEPLNWNRPGVLLDAQPVGGGIFQNNRLTTQVLLEQYLYRERRITPSSVWYPPEEPSRDPAVWEKQFRREQELQNLWWRNCRLFNTVSRYNAIKEAAMLVM